MAYKSYTRYLVRTSFISATIIMFNILALASFFFMQVGSIILIIPAAIIDVIYFLNKEERGIVKKSAKRPASNVASLTLSVIIICLIVASIMLFYGVMNSG